MSFLVHQIALKASGEEIRRTTTIDGEELTIGRDSECGIHLPDLAVDPRHARVRRIDDAHLMIESIGDQPFEVNGRSANRRELDIASGAELGFGGHRIKLERDGETGLPAFTVRRVEAVSDSAEEKGGEVYTLKGLLPGKRMSAWGFALLVLVACLAWPIYSYATYKPLALEKDARRPAGFHADEMWSSGKLSLAHKTLGDNCQACHVDAFVAVRDNACLTCHQDDAHDHVPSSGKLIAARGEPTGFAGFQRAVATTFNKPPGRCVECHTEHEGAGAMPVTEQKFCTECHEGMSARLRQAGFDPTVADASDFGTAHPQFRPMVIVDPTSATPVKRRVVWSPGMREDNGLKFTHAQHLSTTNGIAQMVRRRPNEFGGSDALECKDCHQADPSGTWFQPVVMEKSCETCHSLAFDQVGGTFRTLRHGEPEMVVADLRAYFRSTGPARPINLSGMARRRPGDAPLAGTAADYARAVRFYPTRAEQAIRQVFTKGGACYDCHVVTNGPAAGFGIKQVAQNTRYYSKGWFDHADHKQSDCIDCHVEADSSSDAGEMMIPGMDGPGGCRTCHVGDAGTQLASLTVKSPVESSCAMCHSYHIDEGAPWRPDGQDRRDAVHRAEAVAPAKRGPARQVSMR